MPRKSEQPERVRYGATWRRIQRGDDLPHGREPLRQSRQSLLTLVAAWPRKRSDKPQGGQAEREPLGDWVRGTSRAAQGVAASIPRNEHRLGWPVRWPAASPAGTKANSRAWNGHPGSALAESPARRPTTPLKTTRQKSE